ncbi:MAG: hypothetical protein C0508_25180 [Cyanobacteria bacterium PR.023]|nr:hypothetical protein [Cyanobacteria bacterium PR.023]
MRKSKHTEEQIVAILKEVENRSSVLELSRKHNLQPQSIYRWKEKYGGKHGSGKRSHEGSDSKKVLTVNEKR